MRILHAFLFFSVRTGGGTTDLLYKLARAQASRGHEVTIYTGDHGLDLSYVRSLSGVRVRAFRSWMNCGFYLMPGLISAARREIAYFDVIHLHVYRSFQNIVISHFAKKSGIPYVMDSHGSLGRFARKRRVKAAFDRLVGQRLLRDAARCVGETEMGVREYLACGVAPDKVVRIPPSFPIEEFAGLPASGLFRQRFGIDDSCRIVMFLGRIHWIKGIDILTEAFAQLARRRSDVRLFIVGPDDGYRSTLEALIDRLGIRDRVVFTGFLAGNEKLSALVDADVIVQTSRYEQGAWAPIEGVLCGTPIIVSDNSGAGEDVRRMDAGYLVEFGNRDDLSRTIEYVLDHRAEARAKALSAKAYVEKHLSMDQCVEQYDRLYDDCLRAAPPRACGVRS
jgi:glycosyltransferase involved in cell wall biosynthesis